MAETSVSVSLEDLEKAAEGVFDEKTPETDPTDTSAEEAQTEKKSETEEIKEPESEKEEILDDEPVDNAARSKLGRRFKALESKFDAILEKLEMIFIPREEAKEGELDIDDDEPLTKRELKALLAREAMEKKAAESKYLADYNAQFEMFKNDADDITFHDRIMAEMVKNHNKKRSQNGKEDAELNYLRAKSSIYESERKKSKNPLEKNKDKEIKNLGSPSETKTIVKDKPAVKLDKDAQGLVDYIRRQDKSWTDDKVATILTKEPSLRHRKNG